MTQSFPSHYGPGVDPASKRNEYQEHFLGVKAAGVYMVSLRKPKGRNHWGDLGVDGWTVLGWISRRWDVGIWTGMGWPRIETGGGRL